MDHIHEVMKWFKEFGIELVLFLAGLLGAFVNMAKTKNLTMFERFTAVLSGGIIANYVTPIFINILNLKPSVSNGMAFIVGYMGLKAVEYTIDYIHKKKDKKS